MSEMRPLATKLAIVSRALSSILRSVVVRPATYLLLYLAAIFGFAWFDFERDDAVFYAPYAKLEPASRDDYSNIEMNIFRSVREVAPAVRIDQTSSWLINRENLDVTELAIEESGDFSFTLNIPAKRITNGKPDLAVGGPVENIRVSRRLLYLPNDQAYCRSVTLPDDSTRKPVLEAVFKAPPFMSPVLCWDGAAEGQFREMRSGWAGNPKAFSGSYWRMLYLSAITITSVGFGDIVPISNTARLLCGLEAVLGWVIAGLFLSVVALRRADRRREPSCHPSGDVAPKA